MHVRPASTSIPALLLVLATLLVGCRRDASPDLKPEVDRLRADLAAAQHQLAVDDKMFSTQQQHETQAVAAVESEKKQTSEKEQIVMQKDAQIRALQAELANLKKADALAYAEASASVATGVASIPLSRYQQFLRDFPQSPLAADANRAVAELTVKNDREAKERAALIDPRRGDRETLKHFTDGIATAEEMVPLLKNRPRADVVKMLGTPGKSFRDGTEIGYVDRIIDSTTGGKGTLVISFEADRVVGVRVGYQGKVIKP